MALGDLLKSFILAQLPGIVKANGEANSGNSHLHMSIDVVRWSADVLPYNGHGEDLYRKCISVRYGALELHHSQRSSSAIAAMIGRIPWLQGFFRSEG